MAKKPNAIPGGGHWPDCKIGPDGKFARKDLRMTNRRQADKNSNLNNQSKTPEWATGTGTENIAPGTSIFDPVLCELSYKWFCPPGGFILDPFAGGSVRGIVAAKLGFNYVGVELRAEQVEANRAQAKELTPEAGPVWVQGDSRVKVPNLDGEFDFVFSCPPYGDLEVYSDKPEDLSSMGYEEFKLAYWDIIAHSVAKLKPDRFACFVVGDFRDKKGNYRNFVSHTIEGFLHAGMSLYNEAILINAVGSLPIRAGKQFNASRKLGKCHQNVLVFVKGDGKKAAASCGKIEMDLEALLTAGEKQDA